MVRIQQGYFELVSLLLALQRLCEGGEERNWNFRPTVGVFIFLNVMKRIFVFIPTVFLHNVVLKH
jgi:hypothetical protein